MADGALSFVSAATTWRVTPETNIHGAVTGWNVQETRVVTHSFATEEEAKGWAKSRQHSRSVAGRDGPKPV